MATGSSMSLWLENTLINSSLRNTGYTGPATVYMGLFTSNPGEGDASGVPSGTEVSGGSYVREAIAFGAPAGGISSNSGTVTFPTATANWGTIGYFALFDASTSGHLLYYGPLAVPKTINSGDQIAFAAGNVSLQLD